MLSKNCNKIQSLRILLARKLELDLSLKAPLRKTTSGNNNPIGSEQQKKSCGKFFSSGVLKII